MTGKVVRGHRQYICKVSPDAPAGTDCCCCIHFAIGNWCSCSIELYGHTAWC